MGISEEKPLFRSTKSARERLGGISHTTIYALMNEGKLSSIKLGRRRLIEDESIDRLIADSRESKDDS